MSILRHTNEAMEARTSACPFLPCGIGMHCNLSKAADGHPHIHTCLSHPCLHLPALCLFCTFPSQAPITGMPRTPPIAVSTATSATPLLPLLLGPLSALLETSLRMYTTHGDATHASDGHVHRHVCQLLRTMCLLDCLQTRLRGSGGPGRVEGEMRAPQIARQGEGMVEDVRNKCSVVHEGG